jgi:hypothetical protein
MALAVPMKPSREMSGLQALRHGVQPQINPPAAKAGTFLRQYLGTTEVVPFQDLYRNRFVS